MTRFDFMKRRLLVLGAIALVASACGGGDDDDAESTSGDEAAPTAEAASDTSDPDAATDTGEATAVVDGDETETSSESPPLETTAPNTAAASEVTAPPSTEAPATTNQPVATTAPESNPSETADPATAFDWFAIVEQLLVDLDRIGREPSVELVEVACAANSQCFDEQLDVVDTLTSQGLRLEGGGVGPLVDVEFLNTINDLPIEESLGVGLRVTELVFDGPPATLVNEAGQVIQELEERSDLAPGESFQRFWVLAREAPGSPWKISFIEVRDS